MKLASPLARSVATAKFKPRLERMLEIRRQYQCLVALDNRNVIWICRDGLWQVFERPWWEALR